MAAMAHGMASQHDDLADRLHAAIEAGDLDGVESCYAPELSLWMNFDREEVGRDRAIEILAAFVSATTARRYEITSRIDTPIGYVQEHLLRATGTNGAEAVSAACLMVGVSRDGDSIESIREYLDSRALAALFR